MEHARRCLAEGRTPEPPEDDRALSKMIGVSFLAGLAMIGGAIYVAVGLL